MDRNESIFGRFGRFVGGTSRRETVLCQRSDGKPSPNFRIHRVERLETRALLSVVGFEHALPTDGPVYERIWEDPQTSTVPTWSSTPASIVGESVSFALDTDYLRSMLDDAPLEFTPEAASSTLTIPLQTPDGDIARFTVQESPIMAPELAAKFPEIKTYSGQGIDDPTATIRFDIMPSGLHAQVLSPNGSYYVEPYSDGDSDLYLSYDSSDYLSIVDVNMEGDIDLVPDDSVAADLVSEYGPAQMSFSMMSGEVLSTYALAVSATVEFTAANGGPASALAEITSVINWVNGIYERDVAIRFELIAGTDQLIFDDTDAVPDPAYLNVSTIDELALNQTTIDDIIGDANYDIGHLFSTTSGGYASVGVAGVTGSKARGISGNTTGFTTAHEIGHQFSARHTWNTTSFSGWNAASAMEPGIGTTVMSYGHMWSSPDNLQGYRDPYFHSKSIEDILSHASANPPTTGSTTATGNTEPVVDAGGDYVIPANTPFLLTATGSDADGDTLTYCWEQRDVGPAARTLADPDDGQSPLFRSWLPTEDPTRTFPRLSDLLVNTTVAGESLPSVARDPMEFRVTVRDNHSSAGGVAWDDMAITVIDTGTSFNVTSPNTAVTWTGATNQDVTWNVAGTTGNGINAANVKIFLSTDGGLTFPFELATTANDGSHNVTLPNINTTQARIKVQGDGNIFFDISDENFTINADPVVAGASLTETDDDTRPVEGRADDTYTLALNTDPGGNVTIDVVSEPQTLISADGVDFATTLPLTFNSTASQTIYVRAVNDSVEEGRHDSLITHTISASTSGTYPIGMLIDNITAHIYDDDLPPVVGLDFDFIPGYPAPENWAQYNSFSSTTLTNMARDDGASTVFDLTLSTSSASGSGSGGVDSADQIPRHDPSLTNISGYTLALGEATATWSDLTPGTDYGVYVFGLEGDVNRSYDQHVSIVGATTHSFDQVLTDGQLWINDELGSDARTLQSFEHIVAADGTGQITITITLNSGSDGVALGGLAIREIPVDATPPSIVSLTPTDDAGNVSPSADLVMTFDEAIAKGTGNILIYRSSDDSIFETIDVSNAQVVVTGNQVTINPSTDLDESTEYYVLVDVGALTDTASNPFAGIVDTTTWNFTTSGVPSITGLTPSLTTVDENGAITLSGAFTDVNSGDTHEVSVDWGDGSAIETFTLTVGVRTFSRPHTYLDDNPTDTASDNYTITATVDDGTSTDTETTSVTVTNVAPTLSGLAATSIDENGTTTLSGTLGDVGTLDTFTVEVDWGDGSAVETFSYPAGSTTLSESHQYLDDNPTGTASDIYTISVTLTDDDTGSAAGITSSTVTNVAPVVDAGANQSVNQGETLMLDPATFTDVGTLDTHTATIDWGDGTAVESGTVNQATNTVSGSHIYTTSGTFTVTVTVTDDDTLAHSDTLEVNVASGVPSITGLTPSLTTVDENGAITLSGAFTDVNSGDTHEVSVDWGDGSAIETFTLTVGVRTFSRPHTYLDDNPTDTASDNYTITATVDDGTSTDTETTSVTVTNVAPTLSGLAATSIDENGTTTLSGTLGDVGTLDTFTVEVDWGDGSAVETFSYPAGSTTLSESHQYLDDNPTGTASDIYTISVTLTDDDTGSAAGITSSTVTNVAPVVDAGANQSVNQGETLMLDPATFTDVGTLDTHTATIDWGDGTAVESGTVNQATNTVSGSHIYTTSGTFTVTVTVTDDDTLAHSDTLEVNVASGVPSITGLTPSLTTVDENGAITLSGAFTDVNSGDTHEVSVDWGDGSAIETFTLTVGVRTFSRPHTYLDDNPTDTASDNYTITATVDDGTSTDTETTSVTVTNVAPTLSGLAATSIDENGTTTLSGTLGDVGTLDTFTVEVDWGDGSAVETFSYPAGSTTLSESHQYLDDNPTGTASDIYTISVTLTDDDTGSAAGITSSTVTNVAPVVDAGANQSVNQGETLTLDPATFTDVGTLDTHTATIDWGDGTAVESGTVNQATDTVSGSHIYTTSGTFTVTVTVTDDDTLAHSDTLEVNVASGVPSITSLTPSLTTVGENGAITLDGAFTDVNSGDTHEVSVDWGDGSAIETFTLTVGVRTFSRPHTYLDDNPTDTASDNYTISVTVDDGTSTDTETTSVTVTNVAPTLSGLAATSIDENGTTTLSGTLGDVGTLDTFTVEVDWGDGSAVETFSYPAGSTTLSESHQYLDDNPTGTASDIYTISVTLTDDDTGSAAGITSSTVTNVAPVVDAGANQSVNQGETLMLDPATFTDVGTLDTHTATIDWGDGTAVESGTVNQATNTVSGSHIYTTSGTFTVTVTVTDDDTLAHSDTLEVNVASGVPSITGLTPSLTTVDENGAITLSGAFTDVNSGDTHEVSVDWGDGSAIETFTLTVGVRTFSRPHTYLDDNPTDTASDNYTITATVDDGTSTDTETTSVTVTNVAPTLSGLAATSIDENGTTTLSGTLGDVGTLDTFTVEVDWGDGSAVETFSYPAGSTTLSESHQYLDDNPTGTASDIYTISVTLTDDDTGSAAGITSSTVTNVAPVVDAGANQSVNQGETLTLDPATFTDVGTLDTHTATIDWGDGTAVESGTVNQATDTVSGSHIYTTSGTFTVTVTVTDDDTLAHSDTFTVQVDSIVPDDVTVAEVQINGGDVQRSNIETVAVRFNQATNVQALIGDGSILSAVELYQGATPIPLTMSAFQYDAITYVLTIDLTTDGIGGSQLTMLADGNYELRLATAQITAEGDPTSTLVDDDGLDDAVRTIAFHRLFADFAGNGQVDMSDRDWFFQHYGASAGDTAYDFAFDLDADGVIGRTDYYLWKLQFGTSL